MITTKKELKAYLQADLERFGGRGPGLKDRILHNEVWYIYRYIRHLRYVEYHKGKQGWHKLAFLYHWYKYKHLGFKLHFTIYPGTCGPGLRVYHAGGFVHVGADCRIGKNCTLLPGVVFGNKYEQASEAPIVVGDDCYFGLNVAIFGPVIIGNNVIVGANSVITKDIPDHAIVAGSPARVIRINDKDK